MKSFALIANMPRLAELSPGAEARGVFLSNRFLAALQKFSKKYALALPEKYQ